MKNGGPAFPAAHPLTASAGMSLRDYFAAAALTGILSIAKLDGPDKDGIAALVAFKMADAMLAEREKP